MADQKAKRTWGFYAEVILVGLGVAAVVAWIGAIVYVLIFG